MSRETTTNGQPLPRVKHRPRAVRRRLTRKQNLLIYACPVLLAWALGLICAGLLELVG